MRKTKRKLEAEEKKTQYSKPVFEREERLTFPRAIIEQFNNGRLCVQCSSCHGCK